MGAGVWIMNQNSQRLADINQEIRNFTRAAFVGEISYLSAGFEIQKLAYERDRLWAQDQS